MGYVRSYTGLCAYPVITLYQYVHKWPTCMYAKLWFRLCWDLQCIFINHQRACAARVTVLGLSFHPSVCPSVCYHIFCHYTQQGGQKAIPTGSVPHWLMILTNGHFRKSYGMKTESTSQHADEHDLPQPVSTRFEHGEGSKSNTNGECVVLVCYLHLYWRS